MIEYKDKNKMTMLGQAGEKLVCKYCRERGQEVSESIYTYDNQKDMMVNNSKAEVKTQMLFHMQDAFSIQNNQLPKCMNAKFLFFVKTPDKKDRTIKIYGCDKKEQRDFYDYRTKDGRNMKLIKRSKLKLLEIIRDERLIREFESFSNSDWQK